MDQRVLISGLRLTCLAGFLCTTLSISWVSMAWLGALLVAVFLIHPTKIKYPIHLSESVASNPLKGKPKATEISEEMDNKVNRDIANMFLYDPTEVESLHNFEVVKQNSQCTFARRAKLWGSREWDCGLTLEDNIYRCIPTFMKFTHVCTPLGLDGFLYELPGEQYTSSVEEFGEAVRRVLTILSDNDPAKFHCMDKSYIDKRGWVFQFNKITFFVTTFAPFYRETHSRFSYGCSNGYILLQPEISFAQHDISDDTPHTDWDQPKTVRDRIRIAFKDAGRPYKIRETIYYPMAHDIVKPMEEMTDNLVHWWTKSKPKSM